MADLGEVNNSKSPQSVRRLVRMLLPIVLSCMGVGLASAVVLRASNAAFTASTQNSINHWELGSIDLDDNDNNDVSVMFPAASFSDLVPGSSAVRCIQVTYTGSNAVDVKLFTTITTETHVDLKTRLLLDIDIGTGSVMAAGSHACPGDFTPIATPNAYPTLAATRGPIGSMGTNFAGGHGAWSPSTTSTVIYRFDYQLDPATPDSLQGESLEATFTWEANSL